MKTTLLKQLSLACLVGFSGMALAASNDFVDAAAQGGITEIESSKLALEKSNDADVKQFANQMIEDHRKANEELMALASKLGLEVPDEATLMAKAKEMILEIRDESFDEAYANNQVMAHEQTVELFKKEADSSDNAELKAFAQKTLPKLEHHLEMARQLQSQKAQ